MINWVVVMEYSSAQATRAGDMGSNTCHLSLERYVRDRTSTVNSATTWHESAANAAFHRRRFRAMAIQDYCPSRRPLIRFTRHLLSPSLWKAIIVAMIGPSFLGSIITPP